MRVKSLVSLLRNAKRMPATPEKKLVVPVAKSEPKAPRPVTKGVGIKRLLKRVMVQRSRDISGPIAPLEKIVENKKLLDNFTSALGIPQENLLAIYSKLKQINNRIPEEVASRGDIDGLKREIGLVRAQAGVHNLGNIGEIADSIYNIEEKVRTLETRTDPGEENKRKLAEAENERKAMIEAKENTEKRYYKREIDEETFKKMMQEYEQKIVQSEARIKSLKWEQKEIVPTRRENPAAILSSVRRASGRPEPQTAAFYPRIYQEPPRAYPVQYAQPMPQQIGIAQPIMQGGAERPVGLVKKEAASGVVIPDIRTAVEEPEEEEESSSAMNMTYPLIPRRPKRGDEVFAYTNIRWDWKDSALTYNLFEPKLTPQEKKILENAKELLEERLDVDLKKLKKVEAMSFLMRKTDEVFTLLNVNLPKTRLDILRYYIRRDFGGLEIIEPMMNDALIEDISCDGFNIPIYIFHRNPRIGSVRTNVLFPGKEELDRFVIKLAQRCDKTISVAEPLLNGALNDGSRVQATLGTDIARRGSNFTIRKFTEVPLTPVDLINFGTINSVALAYLWFAVEHGKSVLIGGTTASGKTSMLNVLSLFIKPTKKIVSIEDTAELRLPHPHWIPEVARSAITEVEGKKVGEVDMFDLLRESLRQRPDYIIVGEVRGKEAYVLFQQMASGHAGLSTIHADSLQKLVDRLTTPPISLPATLIENLDIVVFNTMSRVKNHMVRKVDVILEILGVENDRPVGNEVFRWNPTGDKLETVGKSRVLEKIAYSSAMTEKAVQEEIVNRTKVLEWMRERNVNDLEGIASIFSAYYHDPESVMNYVG